MAHPAAAVASAPKHVLAEEWDQVLGTGAQDDAPPRHVAAADGGTGRGKGEKGQRGEKEKHAAKEKGREGLKASGGKGKSKEKEKTKGKGKAAEAVPEAPIAWAAANDETDADNVYEGATFMQDVDDSISNDVQDAAARFVQSHTEFAAATEGAWSASSMKDGSEPALVSSVQIDAASGSQAASGVPPFSDAVVPDVDDGVGSDVDEAAAAYLAEHPTFASATETAWQAEDV